MSLELYFDPRREAAKGLWTLSRVSPYEPWIALLFPTPEGVAELSELTLVQLNFKSSVRFSQ